MSSPLKFAKMVSSKYAEFASARVRRDLRDNHGREVSRCLVQDIADAVAAVALAKEEDWSYHLPRMETPPTTVALSLDGTCALMCEDGWWETRVGTISFDDRAGERQHTISLFKARGVRPSVVIASLALPSSRRLRGLPSGQISGGVGSHRRSLK